MILSCRTMVCPQLRLPEALALVKEAGYDGIELVRLGAESTPVHPELSVRAARETIQASGLLLTGFEIRPLTGRKADSNERNLAYNLRQLEWDIHLARALSCHEIALFGGAPNAEAREDLVAGIAQLLEKIPDIRLNIGSRPETCLVTLADYLAVLPQQPERARLLLDTGALRAAGEDPLAVARAFTGRIGSVRLDPSAMDAAALLATLEACGYDGPLTIDLPPADDPLAAASQQRAAAVYAHDGIRTGPAS
jgi:sugar phosphate isomerase/epimerase